MDADSTYADPNPIQFRQDVHFNIGGRWTHPVEVASVRFTIYEMDAKFFDEAMNCDGGASCPTTGIPGQLWNSVFDFLQIPGASTDYEYKLQVTA